MQTFDDRRNSFEKKFACDQEARFKLEARRNKLLGHWAAGLLGLSGTHEEDYTRSVIRADMHEPGDLDVFRKLKKDFDEKGVAQSDQQIRCAIDDMLAKAIEQTEAESR